MITIVFIGLISGILTGITGLQYGILVPALILSGIMPNINTAVGTLLYATLPPVSLASVYYYYKKGEVDIRNGNFIFFYFTGIDYSQLSIEKNNLFHHRMANINYIYFFLFPLC
jgi:uncharacterized membrane protein YfcA